MHGDHRPGHSAHERKYLWGHFPPGLVVEDISKGANLCVSAEAFKEQSSLPRGSIN